MSCHPKRTAEGSISRPGFKAVMISARSELKDKLIGSEEFSERHYEAMYERYLINLFHAVELEPALRRLDKVVELLEPDVRAASPPRRF